MVSDLESVPVREKTCFFWSVVRWLKGDLSAVFNYQVGKL